MVLIERARGIAGSAGVAGRSTADPWETIAEPTAEAILPFKVADKGNVEIPGDIQRLESRERCQPIKRILVMKLDHFGDFIIGLPAMTELRKAFPSATIRLICGRWNERNAAATGLFDEIFGFNLFPERPYSADTKTDPLGVFDEAVHGRFDLAIDLRVDDDSRHLLARVNARLRCGIGSASRYPLLDIALPEEHEVRANTAEAQFRFFPPSLFQSKLPFRSPLHHFGPLTPGEILRAPPICLPAGKLIVEFRLTVRGHLPGFRPSSLTLQVIRDGVRVAGRTYGRKDILALRRPPLAIEIENSDENAAFEFAINVEGTPRPGTVHFSGVVVHATPARDIPRFRPAYLHIGEKLALLVALAVERTRPLYEEIFEQAARTPETGSKRRTLRLVVAPFSNSSIRDWPVEYYAALISLLIEELDCEIMLLGTPEQSEASLAISASVNSDHVVNAVGKTSWSDVQDVLRSSDLVICNNSGIAHQAGAVGSNLLSIYSASHPPREWGPRGPNVTTLMHNMPCSPCGYERLRECPFEHACMRQLTPELVFLEALAALNRRRTGPEYGSADRHANLTIGPADAARTLNLSVSN